MLEVDSEELQSDRFWRGDRVGRLAALWLRRSRVRLNSHLGPRNVSGGEAR